MVGLNESCACGCGQQTNQGPSGVRRQYLRGHNRRGAGRGWIEQGYRYVSVNGRKIAEHRLVVERREGRKLSPDEVVHHVDHDRFNNDPDNLLVLSRSEHARLHPERRSRWSPKEKSRARELRSAGMTIQEVACALGRSFPSTQRQLARMGRDGER